VNLRLLIDGIVHQTTILIAQLSTASGVRSPLAHVADQIFFDLAREIEAQGVKKHVAADMFGLVLRSYQKKMQRLAQSSSMRDRTLWQAILELIETEQPTRSRIFERFRNEGERDINAVLNDLVRSGLVFATGTGDGIVYGFTTDAVRERVLAQHDVESVANIVWVKVFRAVVKRRADLAQAVPIDGDLLDRAVGELLATGRLKEVDGELQATNFVVPLGSDQGWEAAILDHFRAVALAIATKVRSGTEGSSKSDRVGGSTFTFNLTAGHPFEADVYDLLRRMRLDVHALWDRSSRYNEENPLEPDRAFKVTFYLGQTVEERDEAEEPMREGGRA
jgi:hypothetical protein